MSLRKRKNDIPLLSNDSGGNENDNNDGFISSPTITSSLIDHNDNSKNNKNLKYNKININNNNNDQYDNDTDNIFSLFYNKPILYQDHFTDCRILVITGEKDITRITLDELIFILNEIKKFDINLSSTPSTYTTNTTSTTTTTTSTNEKANLIIKEYLNNPIKSFYIDIYGLLDDELITLSKVLNIHHLNVDDMLSEDTSEKCEQLSNYFFIVASEMAKVKNSNINNINNNNNNNNKRNGIGYLNNNNNNIKELKENFFYMFLFKRLIFVLHKFELDSFANVFKAFRYLKNKDLVSTEWILCNYMESINELIALQSDRMMNEVRQLDDFGEYDDYNKDNNGGNNGGSDEQDQEIQLSYTDLYIRIGKASKCNTNLLSNLFNKDVLMSSLSRQPFSNETKLYLRHINDKSLRLKEKIKLCEELLEGIHTTYINKIALVLNEESHALTVSMKKFANYGLIGLPLTLIATLGRHEL